jgi:phosphoglycerate dehydrogenase-like enzyme
MRKAAFFGDEPSVIEQCYGEGRRERIAALCDLYPHVVTRENFARHAEALREVEAVFSAWGAWLLTDEQMQALPKLRIFLVAKSSVKALAPPLLQRGIVLVSAWGANAIPVAEFVLAQVLLSAKGYFRNVREFRQPSSPRKAPHGPGNFEETVAVLGAGQVGRRLIRLLKNFDLRILVYDPYLTDAEAAALGAEKVSLEAAFERSIVVSNHIPGLPQTRRLLRGDLFARMRQGATFINISNGPLVDFPAFVEVMRNRPDLTALLDTPSSVDPGPLSGSCLWDLPNVVLSSHIAGALGRERLRLGDCMIEEYLRWERGEPLRWQVSSEMLARLA